MSLPNPGMDFTPFDTLPAASLDDLVENIEALAAGSGLNNNAISAMALSASETTDFVNGAVLVANTWTDFKGNQNFTVTTPGANVVVWLNANALGGGSGSPTISYRFVLDSGGTPVNKLAGGAATPSGGDLANFFVGGPVVFPNLSAGVHTIKTQVLSNGTPTLYCRTATNPNVEFFTTNVMELKK